VYVGQNCIPGSPTYSLQDVYTNGCCGQYGINNYPYQAACGYLTTTTTTTTTTKKTTTTTKAPTTTTKAPTTVFRLCTAGNVGFGNCSAINQCRSVGATGSICS
jgi:hypothetical protein